MVFYNSACALVMGIQWTNTGVSSSSRWFFKGEVPATVRMGTDLHSALDVTGKFL